MTGATTVPSRPGALTPPGSPLRHKRKIITHDLLPTVATDVEDHYEDNERKGLELCVSRLPTLCSSCRGREYHRIRINDRGDVPSPILERSKIGGYFFLWYALNVVYNIINKRILNAIPAPLAVGSIQFGIGALYAASLWILRIRPKPKLSPKGRRVCSWIAVCHAVGQLLVMVSVSAGTVSFTHIVKALEPFFSALVSALVFGKWMKLPVYLSLIPVVGGVGYACLKERSFSWLAFWSAMGSNLAFSLRAAESKAAMTNYIGENLSSANLFGVVTCISFLLSLPVAFAWERSSFLNIWSYVTSVESFAAPDEIVCDLMLSGLFHYLNNEVMYLALSNVHPVTLAVGNTMKRVFIMVASILVFRNPVSVQAGIGSAVGISGVLLYSLTKQHYEKLEAAGQY